MPSTGLHQSFGSAPAVGRRGHGRVVAAPAGDGGLDLLFRRFDLAEQAAREFHRRGAERGWPDPVGGRSNNRAPAGFMPSRHAVSKKRHFHFVRRAANRLGPWRGVRTRTGGVRRAEGRVMAGSGRRRLRDGGCRTQRGGRHVVVVESPAKARTIGAWLGSSYRVMATRGHVRDLPAKAGSVDPVGGFSMVYETGKRAARTLGAIAKALARADILVLATDPDREGEAIAWQVLSWLTERYAVDDRPVLRGLFHEVTPAAVRRALVRPRAIDMDLMRAWQARRALDYLEGHGVSPVLWRKLPGCRSAGRVQSVALRLVCEREAEMEAFAPKAYWTVEAELAAQDGAPFPATLCGLDGDGIDDAGLASERMAKDAVERIRAGTFAVLSVERDTLRRQPLPPFTTATLQQEAARRLGFGIGETMAVAQRLYEDVDLGDESAGLVTYMRTDSTVMATTQRPSGR